MKKIYLIILPAVFLLLLLLYLFYPRSVEHGILAGSSPSESSFYINGSLRGFKSKTLNYENYTVFNFKYNVFKAYGFTRVYPLEERVMVKSEKSFELEKSGSIPLSNLTSYYFIDKDNNLTLSDARKIIVGKDNVKSFVDKKGNLKTFMLAPMDYSTMRVAVSTTAFKSIYHDKLEIKSSSPMELFSFQENYKLTSPAGESISIQNKNNQMTIITKDSSRIIDKRIYIKGDSMYITSISRGDPLFTPSYGGVIEISPSANGLLAINEVSLEEYLSKVVPSEMPASSALEALKCQAVAARTYAISDMLGNRYASLGFHVDDSTQSQVYNNIPLQPRSTEAVNLTKGLIMTYEGTPIDAKYYSSSAGTSVRYRDVWFKSDGSSEEKPYLETGSYISTVKDLPESEEEWLKFYKDKNLQSIDSVSPYFRWQVEFSPQALTSSLNKSLKIIYEKYRGFMVIRQSDKIVDELPELLNLKDIRILKRSDGGNIIQISYIFENAVIDLSGDYYIRIAMKCSKEYAGEQISIIRHKGSPLTNSSSLPSSFFSVEKAKDKFIIYGGGYGHGAGMSQYGAMELGKSGKDYRAILNTFYKDVTIENIYQ